MSCTNVQAKTGYLMSNKYGNQRPKTKTKKLSSIKCVINPQLNTTDKTVLL